MVIVVFVLLLLSACVRHLFFISANVSMHFSVSFFSHNIFHFKIWFPPFEIALWISIKKSLKHTLENKTEILMGSSLWKRKKNLIEYIYYCVTEISCSTFKSNEMLSNKMTFQHWLIAVNCEWSQVCMLGIRVIKFDDVFLVFIVAWQFGLVRERRSFTYDTEWNQ